MKARARALPKGQMNKLETRYAGELELRRRAGEIIAWYFEPVQWLLCKVTSYRPDFMVVMLDGTVEFHEAKGFWDEKNRIKTKLAASKFPWFRFVGVQWSKRGGWSFEEFPADGDPAAQVAAMGGR